MTSACVWKKKLLKPIWVQIQVDFKYRFNQGSEELVLIVTDYDYATSTPSEP